MKPKNEVIFGSEVRAMRAGARPHCSGSILSALLVAAAVLLGPGGGGFRALAAFPSSEENEHTQSMGVVQIIVDSSFAFLMEDPDGAGALLPYPGWTSSALTFTSPVLFDNCTKIGVSKAHQRVTDPPTYFPVLVGQTLNSVGCAPVIPLTQDSIPNYTAYVPPDDGLFDPITSGSGPREVLTEIQQFNLAMTINCYSNADPRVPSNIPGNPTLVRAGRDNTYNGGAAFYLRPSIGRVQSVATPAFTVQPGPTATDFPANSFFDIYVEVTMPRAPNTASTSVPYFPVLGAVLTNVEPLIVESLGLPGPNLPPSVVYTHTPPTTSQPFAVRLKFKADAPDGVSWHAGDVFGNVVLAGHGTMDPCTAKASTVVSNFLNAVLGPPGELAPQAIVGRSTTGALFPSQPSTYGSARGTNFLGKSIDAVYYTNGASVLCARDFIVSNFVNSVPLPAPGGSKTYTNNNTVVTFNTSFDGINFFPAQGTGVVQVLLINTNSNPSGVTNCYTEITSMLISGTYVSGSFQMRESTNKASPGRHSFQNTAGSFRVGGNFNLSSDFSFNGGLTWRVANRPIMLQQLITSVACGPPGPLTVVKSGSSIILSWSGSTFRLQCTPSLNPTAWVNVAGTSPVTLPLSTGSQFYRLICP